MHLHLKKLFIVLPMITLTTSLFPMLTGFKDPETVQQRKNKRAVKVVGGVLITGYAIAGSLVGGSVGCFGGDMLPENNGGGCLA